MNKFLRTSIFTALCALGLGMSGQASALIMGFQTEIHTRNDTFAIRNTSNVGVQITQVKVTLGDNTQFDTLTLLGLNDNLSIGHFDDGVAGNTSGYTYDLTSTFTTSETIADEVGYAGPLSTDVTNTATMATFNFTNGLETFDANEAWGFNVNYVERGDGTTQASGSDMNNASIMVTFLDIFSQETSSLTFDYGTFSGGGQDNKPSFPGDATSAVPIPATVWLFGSALFGLAGFKRSKVKA